MHWEGLLNWLDGWVPHLQEPVVLGAIALLAYIFGRRTRQIRNAPEAEQARRDLRRAKGVASELEKIAEEVRRSLATHHSSVAQFKDRVYQLSGDNSEVTCKRLYREAEQVLRPTLKLAMEISHAYDQIRQQSNQLLAFAEVRTDPLTGLRNRRALDETLENMFAEMSRYETPFCVAMYDIDHFKKINDAHGHLYGDRMLQLVGQVLDDNVRETDSVYRYGGEEFVIVMPHAPLDGAWTICDRLREMVQQQSPLTISGGVSAASMEDAPHALLSRADAALYSAKAAGRNRVYTHDGGEITVESEESEISEGSLT